MTTQTVKLTIAGMHCTSCALNIDFALEDLPGVISSTTHYAQSKTVVAFNPDLICVSRLQQCLKELGYSASLLQ